MPLISRSLLKPLTGRWWSKADIAALGRPIIRRLESGRLYQFWRLERVLQVHRERHGQKIETPPQAAE